MPNHYVKPRYLEQKATAQNNAPSVTPSNSMYPQPLPYPDPTRPPGWNPGNYADPYDPRIGNGALPVGIVGSANRAYTRGVQSNELASSAMAGLLDQNGQYIRTARQSGVEFANARGLGNSSLAAGNAQRAAIEAGAPLALADARAYGDAASENLRGLNERALADMDYQSQESNRNNQLTLQQMQDAGLLHRQRENLGFEGEQNGLDRVQQRDMVRVNAEADDWMDDNRAGRNYYYESRGVDRDYRYDDRRARRDHEMGIDAYNRRTGIDLRAEHYTTRNNLQDFAMRNPHLVPPEVLASFMNMSDTSFREMLDGLLGGRP